MSERRLVFAVTDVAASYRKGLEAAFRTSGHRVVTPPDPVGWARENLPTIEPGRPGRQSPVSGSAGIIVTLRSENDCETIDSISRVGGIVVALLPEPSIEWFRDVLAHGAVSAIDWNEDPDRIVAVAVEAVRGRSLLPREIVKALTSGASTSHAPTISAEEAHWLVTLAGGATVAALADDVGYSERAMFRKLHDLYVNLGVKNRSEALLAAERAGILRKSDA